MGDKKMNFYYWSLIPYVDNTNCTMSGLIYSAMVDSLQQCTDFSEDEVESFFNKIEFNSQAAMLPNFFQARDSVAMPVIIEAETREVPNDFVGVVETNGLAWLYQPDPPEENLVIAGFSAVWPIMLLVLVLTGYAALIIWLAELRVKANRQFDSSFTRGFLESYWFAYISATTVGYGDKVPRSPIGKFLSLLWIICGISLMSSFTATMTTLINNLAMPQQNELPPMHNVQIGVVNTSIDHRLVMDRGGEPIDFPTLDDLFAALYHHEVDSIAVDPNVYCANAEKFNRNDLEFRLGITDATIIGYIYRTENTSLLTCLKSASFFMQHELDKHIAETFSQKPKAPRRAQNIESSMFGENGHNMILIAAGCLGVTFLFGVFIEVLLVARSRKRLAPGDTRRRGDFAESVQLNASSSANNDYALPYELK